MRDKAAIRMFGLIMFCILLLVVSGCTPHRQPPVLGMEAPQKLETGDVDIKVSPPKNRDLNARVVHIAESSNDEVVADYVKNKVQGELADMGFKMSIQETDFLIELRTDTGLYDSFGEFMIYNGSVKTEVYGPPALNRVGTKTVSAQSERKLGRGAALTNVAEKIAGKVTQWLKTVLTPDRLRAATSNVVVTLPEYSRYKPSAFAAYFVDEISGFPGVKACKVVSTTQKQIVLQVDYNQDAFPEGLDNRLLNLQGPEASTTEKTFLTVTLPEDYEKTVADYSILFTRTVAALNGIEQVKVIESYQATRTLKFEVVFEPGAFPEGLYNRIVSIKELDLLSR